MDVKNYTPEAQIRALFSEDLLLLADRIHSPERETVVVEVGSDTLEYTRAPEGWDLCVSVTVNGLRHATGIFPTAPVQSFFDNAMGRAYAAKQAAEDRRDQEAIDRLNALCDRVFNGEVL